MLGNDRLPLLANQVLAAEHVKEERHMAIASRLQLLARLAREEFSHILFRHVGREQTNLIGMARNEVQLSRIKVTLKVLFRSVVLCWLRC